MAKQPKKEIFISPKGVAIYPYLSKPDTKFKEEGEYRVKLRVPAADAAKLVKQIDAEMENARKQEKLLEAKKKNPKAKIPENTPYKDAVDDEGEETGEIEFTFAASASGVSKKTGKPWERTIALWDAKRKPFKGDIWGGSVLKVAFTVGTYFINAKVGYGVKLYLESAQVLELVQGGNRSADSYGFSEEDGYESTDEASDDSDEASDDSDDSADDADDQGDDNSDDNPDF